MRTIIPFIYGDEAARHAPHAAAGSYRNGTSPAGAHAAREALYLGNINHVIERLQALFDLWEDQHTFGPAATDEMMHRARLAVHEWVANLIQHADFDERVPEIALSLWFQEARLHCRILDNSEGFTPNLDPPMSLAEVCEQLPERGMGLLLLQACAEHVRYESFGPAGHQIQFVIARQPPLASN